jgi:hypothetical protein
MFDAVLSGVDPTAAGRGFGNQSLALVHRGTLCRDFSRGKVPVLVLLDSSDSEPLLTEGQSWRPCFNECSVHWLCSSDGASNLRRFDINGLAGDSVPHGT